MEIIHPSEDTLFASLVPDKLSGRLEIAEATMEDMGVLSSLNKRIFDEERIINSFDRDDLMMLVALMDGVPAGFKIGYRENRFVFYSAKGGVLEEYRHQGIARALLYAMMDRALESGYRRFVYDTFPNMHSGMTILGLREGFRVVRADFNHTYRDFRLRLEKKL